MCGLSAIRRSTGNLGRGDRPTTAAWGHRSGSDPTRKVNPAGLVDSGRHSTPGGTTRGEDEPSGGRRAAMVRPHLEQFLKLEFLPETYSGISDSGLKLDNVGTPTLMALDEVPPKNLFPISGPDQLPTRGRSGRRGGSSAPPGGRSAAHPQVEGCGEGQTRILANRRLMSGHD